MSVQSTLISITITSRTLSRTARSSSCTSPARRWRQTASPSFSARPSTLLGWLKSACACPPTGRLGDHVAPSGLVKPATLNSQFPAYGSALAPSLSRSTFDTPINHFFRSLFAVLLVLIGEHLSMRGCVQHPSSISINSPEFLMTIDHQFNPTSMCLYSCLSSQSLSLNVAYSRSSTAQVPLCLMTRVGDELA
jgi:hypothetical protein